MLYELHFLVNESFIQCICTSYNCVHCYNIHCASYTLYTTHSTLNATFVALDCDNHAVSQNNLLFLQLPNTYILEAIKCLKC